VRERRGGGLGEAREGGREGFGERAGHEPRERVCQRQLEAVSAAPTLFVITDLGAADARAQVACVARALAAGDPRRIVIGLRDHASPAALRLELGWRLLDVIRPAGARLIVHDRVDLACALGADGVQLGRGSISPDEARSLLGSEALMGCSCHDAGELDGAARAGASFATLSPLFASPGKGAPLGVERFRALAARHTLGAVGALPLVALGGIGAGALLAARDAGAVGVAVIRAVVGARDPAPFVEAVFRVFSSRA
jgi:thiamine-phosphate pyrophosphorylase